MLPRRANPKGYERARQLRKELTPAERKLWAYLRNNTLNRVNFRRQYANVLCPFRVGNYIVDFVSIKKKLVIELDGLPSVATSQTGRI
jgi:very-short-patch-repair endonuclease